MNIYIFDMKFKRQFNIDVYTEFLNVKGHPCVWFRYIYVHI